MNQSTLTEFLLARIAEDEAGARDDDGSPTPVGMWDPDRVLAECEAKRTIIATRENLDAGIRAKAIPGAQDDEVDGLRMARFGLDLSIKVLAVVHADHSDYREEWRP